MKLFCAQLYGNEIQQTEIEIPFDSSIAGKALIQTIRCHNVRHEANFYARSFYFWKPGYQ